jgi:hypothetical protein
MLFPNNLGVGLYIRIRQRYYLVLSVVCMGVLCILCPSVTLFECTFGIAYEVICWLRQNEGRRLIHEFGHATKGWVHRQVLFHPRMLVGIKRFVAYEL